MQKDLEETRGSLMRSISGLLERGEKLEGLEQKSSELVQGTKRMKRDVEWNTAGYFWRAMHYINIFRLCYADAW